MAKISAYKLQKQNDAMIARMERKRRNKNNWPGNIMTTKTPKDIIDSNDFYYESIRAKTHKKNVKKC